MKTCLLQKYSDERCTHTHTRTHTAPSSPAPIPFLSCTQCYRRALCTLLQAVRKPAFRTRSQKYRGPRKPRRGFVMWHKMTYSSLAQPRPTLCDPWTVAHQAPLSMGFPRREYWSGLPFPPPGDLPDLGIEPRSPASPALQVVFFFFFFAAELPGSPIRNIELFFTGDSAVTH